MIIQRIEIQNFRNLTQVELELAPVFNVFHGRNGGGKTSLLEAIYFLSSGRSFRTRLVENLFQGACDSFSVVCGLPGALEEVRALGVQRFRGGQRRIRVEGREQSSHVAAAELLPLLLINAEEHRLIAGGPEFRRQFVNWGMFHVEPRFFTCWARLQKIVKQRNAMLKSSLVSFQDLSPWDSELIESSRQMDVMRRDYIGGLLSRFNDFIALLLEDVQGVSLLYYPGWNEKEGLEKSLARSFQRDQQLGYTQHGSHRMDFTLKVGDYLAKDVLSRGQQKLMVYALRLAQGLLLREKKGQACVYLIDDFMAELDRNKRALVIRSLAGLGAQVLVTGVDKEELISAMEGHDMKTFHVEQGAIF